MPRKQNGFGNPKSFAIKGVNSEVNKGRGKKAFGIYPSNRRYGTAVQKTIIEDYNINSDWMRWRKGYEYYNLGASLEFDELNSLLYQGTKDEVSVTFSGKRYATKKSDSRTHYTAKRVINEKLDLGVVTQVFNDRSLYPDNYRRREIWAQVDTSTASSNTLLRRVVGDRVTDGEWAANVTRVMTSELLPAIYYGKNTSENQTVVEIKIAKESLEVVPYVHEYDGDLQALVGNVIYIQNFKIERPIDSSDVFEDDKEFFSVTVNQQNTKCALKILDNNTPLPPAVYDINTLTPIYETNNAEFSVTSKYFFRKSDYQPFFGLQYLTAELVQTKVSELAYSILPFIIQGLSEDDDFVYIRSVPFFSTVALFTPPEDSNFLVFADNSFTRTTIDSYDGEYYHQVLPGLDPWKLLDTDIDPWMDQTFTTGSPLSFADIYCCSCPDFTHALLRMPEMYDSNGNRLNRQQKIPLPSAQGTSSYNQEGLTQAAGTMQSWETLAYRASNRMCKHTISEMFANRLKVKEPNDYPTLEVREIAGKKVTDDINEVINSLMPLLERSEITAVEIILVLSGGLNLTETELASVVLYNDD